MSYTPLPTFLIVLVSVYTTSLLTAGLLALKLLTLGPISFPAGTIAFAISFLITDVTAELYGKRTALRLVLAGLISLTLAYILSLLAVLMPGDVPATPDFDTVIRGAFTVTVGGSLAYILSQTIDVHLFHLLKSYVPSSGLWLRNNASTIVSQLVDSIVFLSFAYGIENLSFALLGGTILAKTTLAVVDTPLCYALVFLGRKMEGSKGARYEI